MNFKIHNELGNIAGVDGLQGYIDISYKALVEKFGEPSVFDDDKSDAEWIVEFEDGVIAFIYNYKNGKNYLGEHGTPVEQIARWHVGGSDAKAVEHLYSVIKHTDRGEE